MPRAIGVSYYIHPTQEHNIPLRTPSDLFPSLTVSLAGEQTLALLDALAGHFGLVRYLREHATIA